MSWYSGESGAGIWEGFGIYGAGNFEIGWSWVAVEVSGGVG